MKELNTYHEHSEDPKLPDSLRANPFTVPKNYFSDAQSVLRSTLRLDQIKSSNPFATPDGYFNILQEQIKAQAMLPPSTESSGMEVPDHYFEELSSRISAQLTEATWRESVQETGFIVPEGYFEQATEQLTDQAKMESYRTALNKDAFEVTPGYFDGLPSRILDRIKAEENVVALPETSDNIRPIGRGISRRIRILAAAASITVILSLGIFWSLTQNPPTVQSASASEEIFLQDLSDEEIATYLAMNNDGLDYLVEYITVDAIERDELSTTNFADQDLEEYIKLMLE